MLHIDFFFFLFTTHKIFLFCFTWRFNWKRINENKREFNLILLSTRQQWRGNVALPRVGYYDAKLLPPFSSSQKFFSYESDTFFQQNEEKEKSFLMCLYTKTIVSISSLMSCARQFPSFSYHWVCKICFAFHRLFSTSFPLSTPCYDAFYSLSAQIFYFIISSLIPFSYQIFEAKTFHFRVSVCRYRKGEKEKN